MNGKPVKKLPQSIIGLGLDLVEVSRLRVMVERSPGFLERVFTDGELAYSMKSRNKYERLAARFAVKEAVIKALDEKRLSLKSIEVANTESGKPLVKVKGRAGARLLVSISHTSKYAVASVIAFG